MTNEDLVGKLNHIEGYLKGAGDQLGRIEETLAKLMQMDRTVTMHGMRFESVERETRELAHDIKNCEGRHKLVSDAQHHRLEYLETASHSAKGFFFAIKIVASGALFMLGLAATWVYQNVERNKDTNVDQKHQLADIRKDMEYLKRLIGK